MPPALIVFFFLVIGLPLIELYVLIEIGAQIGAGLTILLAIATAILGASLMRMQGLQTLARVRAAMDRGEPPALEMMEGMLLLIGGGVLLFPGFITDAFGFLLLVPPFRRLLIRRWLLRQMQTRTGRPGPGSDPHRPGQGRTLEGEYRRLDE